jgi:HTH-like domain
MVIECCCECRGEACKAVGLARSTYRRLPAAQTPSDPDAEMRAWLRAYATKHPCHGFRRAWAALRYDERREVNKKKVHRLWREGGLQVRVRSPRKRAGVSSVRRGMPAHPHPGGLRDQLNPDRTNPTLKQRVDSTTGTCHRGLLSAVRARAASGGDRDCRMLLTAPCRRRMQCGKSKHRGEQGEVAGGEVVALCSNHVRD